MSHLAPGRKADIAMLLTRRQTAKDNHDWSDYDKCQRRIEALVEEGKDPKICSLRERLIGAHAAKDQKEIEKISKQIDQYVKYKGQHLRWLKKG